jgi:putative nucleotidyltransferase with HDIG domain
MQASRPAQFWVLFTAMGSAALAVLGFTLSQQTLDWSVALIVFGLAATFEASYVYVNEDTRATLSVVVVFGALAYGGLPLAIVAALGTGLVSGATVDSERLVKGSFNTSLSIVEAAAAAFAFSRVAGTDLVAPLPADALQGALGLTSGLLVSGLVAASVNALMLGALLSSVRGLPFRVTAWRLFLGIIGLQVVYVGLAAIGYALVVETGTVALVLVAVPLFLARHSLRTVEEQQEAYDKMVRAFVKAIELKDGYTRGHAERVSDLSVLVAERMGLSYEDRQLIRYGAILHDVGKIGVSLGILCKAGPLDDDEFAEMKTHPEIGAEMLRDIDFLRPALAIVHHHHERMDGRGYPTGLEGDQIPLLTRVVTAVDAFDAMTSTRSYRKALPISVALEELRANAGTQFDAEVVGHLVDVIGEEGWEITDEPVQVAPMVGAPGMATS